MFPYQTFHRPLSRRFHDFPTSPKCQTSWYSVEFHPENPLYSPDENFQICSPLTTNRRGVRRSENIRTFIAQVIVKVSERKSITYFCPSRTIFTLFPRTNLKKGQYSEQIVRFISINNHYLKCSIFRQGMESAESPLDVLSRAATMVQDNILPPSYG